MKVSSLDGVLEAVEDAASDPIVCEATDGTVTRWNRAAERVFGYARDEIVGRPVAALGLDGGRARARDGRWIPVAVTTAALRDGAGLVHVVRVRADAAITTSALATGTVHEINNPLAYMSANLDLLAEELCRPDLELRRAELATMVREAQEGVERIRKLVQGLRAFASADRRRAPVQLDAVLARAIAARDDELRRCAELSCELPALPPLLASAPLLDDALGQLLANAIDAIPPGQPERHAIRITAHLDPGWVVIEIRDTGAGISPEARGRLGEPFFSTKPGRPGLGLAACESVVRGLGGELAFDSPPGGGTVARVRLPVPDGPEPADPLAAPDGEPRPGRSGRVLIIDDEIVFAKSLRRMLARDYTVIVENDPRRALDHLQSGARYDAILCDLSMPGLDGGDVHQELQAIDRDQARRMIFLTGDASVAKARQFLDRVDNPCFEKPCNLDDLRAAVRRMLE